MRRLFIVFFLIFSINSSFAQTNINKKLFSLYPYGTQLSNNDIAKIIGIPIPKPDVETVQIESDDKNDVSDIYTRDHFTFVDEETLTKHIVEYVNLQIDAAITPKDNSEALEKDTNPEKETIASMQKIDTDDDDGKEKLNIEVNYLSSSAKTKLEKSGSNIKIINK